jgi:hypothetical protein
MGRVAKKRTSRRPAPNPPGDPRGFPWPKKAPVYHATTALRAILNDGFKTRRERGGAHALGGGTDIAVSFTFDRRTAIAIALGLRTIRGIARGEIGLGDLIIQAEQVAPGVLSQVRKNLEIEMHAVTPEDVARIDRGLRWWHTYGSRPSEKESQRLIEMGAVEELEDRGYGVYSGWTDARVFAEVTNDMDAWTRFGQYHSGVVQAYKSLLHFGGWNGESGRKFYDPLFFMTSLEPLAALDDRDIGIVRAHLDADWLCSGPKNAEAMGYELPATGPSLYQWAEGCETELDRQRHDDTPAVARTRSEYMYRHTLPQGWEPPDPADTVALLSSMAEVRVWNTRLIHDVEETENLNDVLNYARDAWDRKGLVVDEPFWMPFHRDEIPFGTGRMR